jgi:hypothetical protein
VSAGRWVRYDAKAKRIYYVAGPHRGAQNAEIRICDVKD